MKKKALKTRNYFIHRKMFLKSPLKHKTTKNFLKKLDVRVVEANNSCKNFIL